jgi:hypothetical protein
VQRPCSPRCQLRLPQAQVRLRWSLCGQRCFFLARSGVDGAHEIDPAWIAGKRKVGVTAGASAPDVLIDGVIARLRALGAGDVSELAGEPESMVFALPKELRLQLVN